MQTVYLNYVYVISLCSKFLFVSNSPRDEILIKIRQCVSLSSKLIPVVSAAEEGVGEIDEEEKEFVQLLRNVQSATH